MIAVEEAREEALSFFSKHGLKREFIENVSIKRNDAEILIRISQEYDARNILEVGTFVGVSTSILGLCLPDAQVVCVDPNLPVEVEDMLCLKHFEIHDARSTFEYVEKALSHFGLCSRFTLKPGYFSCHFPEQRDLKTVTQYGIQVEDSQIIGPDVCEEFGPFDIVFLDGDHRTEAVTQDLALLVNHVKPGGMVVLHDCGSDYWGQQVRQGVAQFLGKHPQKRFEVEDGIGFLSIS